jgi:single-strand DNA-binding protein
MDLNKAMIIGRLTADPESRTTPQGTSVASFSLATNLVWNDASGQKQEKVEYHNIVVWRKLAEICSQYLRKGSKIYIEGRLQTRSWDGQDGVKRYRTEIIADNMIMLDRAGSNTGGNTGGGNFEQSAPAPAAPQADVPETELPVANSNGNDSNEEIKVENIPF